MSAGLGICRKGMHRHRDYSVVGLKRSADNPALAMEITAPRPVAGSAADASRVPSTHRRPSPTGADDERHAGIGGFVINTVQAEKRFDRQHADLTEHSSRYGTDCELCHGSVSMPNVRGSSPPAGLTLWFVVAVSFWLLLGIRRQEASTITLSARVPAACPNVSYASRI